MTIKVNIILKLTIQYNRQQPSYAYSSDIIFNIDLVMKIDETTRTIREKFLCVYRENSR